MRTNRRMIDIKKKHGPPPPPRFIAVWQKAIVASFFALIFGFGIYRVAAPTPTVSYLENRELKQMPPFSLKNLFGGGYTKGIEDFYADTFIFRDTFMEAGDAVSFMYKIPLKGVDTVLEAEDNVMDLQNEDEQQGGDDLATDSSADAQEMYAIPTHGNPDGMEMTSGADSQAGADTGAPVQTEAPDTQQAAANLDEPADMKQSGTYLLTDTAIYRAIKAFPNQYGKLMSALNRLQQSLPDNRVIVMVPPESYAFYAPAKYYEEQYDEQKTIQDMYAQLDPRIVAIDVCPELSRHTSEYIYFRTDHHWTARGAYWAYTVFADRLGMEPQNLEDMPADTLKEKFLGSYYQKFKDTAKARIIRKNPDFVEYFMPTVQNTSTAYNNTTTSKGKNAPVILLTKIPNNINYYRTFLGGDYPYMHIATQTLNGRSIMIVKDSYANAFVPFLLANYQDIYVVDYRDYNSSGKPGFKITSFVQAHSVQDVMVISCFDLTNSSTFMNWLVKAFP